jgi:hypothetical protein
MDNRVLESTRNRIRDLTHKLGISSESMFDDPGFSKYIEAQYAILGRKVSEFIKMFDARVGTAARPGDQALYFFGGLAHIANESMDNVAMAVELRDLLKKQTELEEK